MIVVIGGIVCLALITVMVYKIFSTPWEREEVRQHQSLTGPNPYCTIRCPHCGQDHQVTEHECGVLKRNTSGPVSSDCEKCDKPIRIVLSQLKFSGDIRGLKDKVQFPYFKNKEPA